MAQYLDYNGVAYLSYHIATNYNATLGWNSTVSLGKVGNTTITAKLPSNPNTDHYHTSGSWKGLKYKATAVNNAGELSFTLPTGTSSTTVALGNHTHNYIPLSGSSAITGNLEFSNSVTELRGIIGTVGDNDYWRVVGGATRSSSAYLEIATADDGTEPIYVRQYSSGKFVTLARTATLLDASGNTSFPGKVTASSFSGSLSGNASTASAFSSNATVSLSGDVTGTASSTKGWSLSTSLSNTGVTSGNYGPTSNITASHKGTFSVPFFNVDAKGRILKATSYTITLPSDNDNNNKVTQNATSSNANYRLLLSANANDTSETNTSNKSSKFYANSYTGVLTAPTFSGSLSGNATSATTASSATSATKLSKNSTFNDNATGGFQYYDSDISNTSNNAAWSAPTSGWHQILHNDLSVANYWTELAFPVNDVNGLAWRQRRSANYYGWYRILDSNNWKSYVTLSALGAASSSHALSISSNGTGNAVTAISVNGHGITVTKGTTFSTTDTKVTTVSVTGSGNAVTTGSISSDGKTLTLTKGTTFATSDTNTSHAHSYGVGLIGSGSDSTSGGTYTYKAALTNETKSSNASTYTAGASSKFYSVQLDSNGKLAVYVPWTDNNTTYAKGTYNYLGLIQPWYSHTSAATGPTATTDSTAVAVNAHSTTAGRYYPIEMDSNGRAFVNVPWVNSTYTVGSNNFIVQGNGTTASTFSANATSDVTLNIKGSGGTSVSATSGVITVSSTSVGSANLTIQGNGTTATTFSSNASTDASLNIKPGTNIGISTSSGAITINNTSTATTDSALSTTEVESLCKEILGV